jgi:hypothetical protein
MAKKKSKKKQGSEKPGKPDAPRNRKLTSKLNPGKKKNNQITNNH